MIFDLTIFCTSLFVGFAAGRLGDKWGGHLNAPHHWIYGLFLIVAGAAFTEHTAGIAALGFGIGHFVSDLDDFLHFRIYGPDEPHQWKFWSIK